MARTKKTKAASKKPTAKKTRTSTGKIQMQGLLRSPRNSTSGKQTRRPPNNPDMPETTINELNNELNDIKTILDNYSQHLRSLDRMRLNGVGVKKLGFVERSYELALENGEFLPHYLTIERFGNDIQYFIDFRTLTDLCDQIREKLWNITLQSADIAYTDALEFYASVREASNRRVDAAETMHHELSTFFPRSRKHTEETTDKKAKRDFNSLLHGKHDGRLVIENVTPKLTRGKRKIIDETFKDTAQYKDIEDGTIQE